MQLKIQLKSNNAVSINGVAIEDSTAAQVIRYGSPVEYLKDGIVVSFNSWELPFPVLERIWPLLRHEQKENRKHYGRF